ncbi:TIGR02186 family protein [soil metagenome]
MLRVCLLLLGLLAAPAAPLQIVAPAAAQETVVTGISTDNIALTADFDGSEIFVFGAVRREGPAPEDAGPLDIIITITGPPQPLTVWRKERRFGIWMNTHAVNVARAPSLYAIASTGPVRQILTETERLRHTIGLDQAVRWVGGHPAITDTSPFADAVVRIKTEDGLYAQTDEGVRLAEETLFQAHFALPANLVEGSYLAEFFLVRNRAVIHAGATTITVEKTGIERWIYNLSQRNPLAYGALSVGLALFAGWLAAAAFRLAGR